METFELHPEALVTSEAQSTDYFNESLYFTDIFENETSLVETTSHDEFDNDSTVDTRRALLNESDTSTTISWWFPFRGVIVTVITLGIIASNLINLNVWGRNTRLPLAARRFLINLSSCDLLLGLVATSSAIYPAFTGHWPYGQVWCQVTGIVHGMSVTLSIWSIAMVSVDRYIATLKPFSYKNIMSRACSCYIIIGMWLAAGLSFISPLFTKPDLIYYQYREAEAMCGMYWEYREYCIITGFYIPGLSGVVLVYTSYNIHRSLTGHKVEPVHDATRVHHSKQRVETSKRALKIIIATSICYFISWGPYSVLTILQALSPSTIVLPDWLTFIIMWAANGNSMLNVFIYSFTNTHFQAEAKAMFRCKRDTRNKVVSSSFSRQKATKNQEETLPTVVS